MLNIILKKLNTGNENVTSLFCFLLLAVIPVETILVKLDDHLRDLDVSLLGGHEIRLVAILPLDEEEELPRLVSRSDDLLGGETPGESSGLLFSFGRFSCGRSRGLLSVRLPFHSLGLHLLLLVLVFQISLKLLNLFVGSLQVLLGLPRVVVRIVVAAPLDEILHLPSLLGALVHDSLHFILLVTHP